MSWFIAAIVTAITSFVATNIDDIVILMIFFSQRNAVFRIRHIVLGQYLGFIGLILVSLPGLLGGFILPKAWIGLLGFAPIALGIRQLFHSEDQDSSVQTVSFPSKSTGSRRSATAVLASLMVPQTYHVAAVTFANGGDNIGVYVPLFASSHLASFPVILCVFLILKGVWCYVAYYITRHPVIAPVLTRYGKAIVPYVLIALGIFILMDNSTYRLLPIFQS